jgi:hypothetical protein
MGTHHLNVYSNMQLYDQWATAAAFHYSLISNT